MAIIQDERPKPCTFLQWVGRQNMNRLRDNDNSDILFSGLEQGYQEFILSCFQHA